MSDLEHTKIIWNYMRATQSPEKSEVIIGLGSDDIMTAEWCAKLYHEGLAPLVVFSGARGEHTGEAIANEADAYAARAIELGVPGDAILKETAATNTGENIAYTHELLRIENIALSSLILVTKPYTLRRAYATFAKQWPDTPLPRMYCSAIDDPLERYCAKRDYSIESMADRVVGQLQRIKEYPALGFQIEQDIPKEVLDSYEELIARGYTNYLAAL